MTVTDQEFWSRGKTSGAREERDAILFAIFDAIGRDDLHLLFSVKPLSHAELAHRIVRLIQEPVA